MAFGLLSVRIYPKQQCRGQDDTQSKVIEATEFKFDVRSDLRGCLEVTMASEATKMAIRSRMHMEPRVIRATEYNFEIRSDL